MDIIKKSFENVKRDIFSLRNEVSILKEEVNKNTRMVLEFAEILEELLEKNSLKYTTNIPTDTTNIPTDTTNIPTDTFFFKPRKPKNLGISTGNEGVPTDKQTNRQTDKIALDEEDSIEKVANILDSLDSLKKEVRLKIKRLTEQEMLVFSTLYQLEEEFGYTNYKTLAEKLDLSESSIRDYVGRLIKKGIPVDKIKVNNKHIHLKVSNNLRKIASLPTILQLREI